MLNSLGVTDIRIGYIVKTFWPILLIIWGIQFFMYPGKGKAEIAAGIIILAIGILLQGNKLQWFTVDLALLWNILWLIILLLLGVALIRIIWSIRNSQWSFMGMIERKKEKWTLHRGGYWALIGGIELDLRDAILEKGEHSVVCNVILGNIKIILPEKVTTVIDATAVLGGIDVLGENTGGILATIKNEHHSEDHDHPDYPVVKIYSRAVMGGIEIQSHRVKA